MKHKVRAMRLSSKLLILVSAVGIMAIGCDGDSTSPGDNSDQFSDFSAIEKSALVTAIMVLAEDRIDSDTLAAPVDFYNLADVASIALDQIEQVGGLGSEFDAFAVEIVFAFTSAGEQSSGAGAVVLAWSGLETSLSTVDGVLVVGGVRQDVTTFSGSVAITDALSTNATELGAAGYYDVATDTGYLGASGTFTVASSAFNGDAQSCDYTILAITIPCTAVRGRMTGSFDFVANTAYGTSTGTFTQSSTSFDLPAVRFTIQVNQ